MALKQCPLLAYADLKKNTDLEKLLEFLCDRAEFEISSVDRFVRAARAPVAEAPAHSTGNDGMYMVFRNSYMYINLCIGSCESTWFSTD